MRVVAALLGSLAAHTLIVVALVAAREPPRPPAPAPTYDLEAPVLLTAGLIQRETGGLSTSGGLAGPRAAAPGAPPAGGRPAAAVVEPPAAALPVAPAAPAPPAAASQAAAASQPGGQAGGATGRSGAGGAAGAGGPSGAGGGRGGGGDGVAGAGGGSRGGAGPGGPDPRALIAARVAAQRHYPLLARRRGLEGLVLVEFAVGDDGVARDVAVVQSAGAVLDEAARTAVLRARALPRVAGRVQVPVRFRLTDPQ
jgi:TonB family protein